MGNGPLAEPLTHSGERGRFVDCSCPPLSWEQCSVTSSLFKGSLCTEKWTIAKAFIKKKKIGLLFPLGEQLHTLTKLKHGKTHGVGAHGFRGDAAKGHCCPPLGPGQPTSRASISQPLSMAWKSQ